MATSLSSVASIIISTLSSNPSRRSHGLQLAFFPKRIPSVFVRRSADNGAPAARSAVVEEDPHHIPVSKERSLCSNGALAANTEAPLFKDPRWAGGTWDLKQFQKGGATDWDGVIDAEANRRKWLEGNPEAATEHIIFDTSIIPWWAWFKRYNLPETELLSGRAAMIGFFAAYFVDGLTGVGLVDQTGNFCSKILLLISVVGVMLAEKTEDIGKLKKFIEETILYDKQWRATWLEDDKKKCKNK